MFLKNDWRKSKVHNRWRPRKMSALNNVIFIESSLRVIDLPEKEIIVLIDIDNIDI